MISFKKALLTWLTRYLLNKADKEIERLQRRIAKEIERWNRRREKLDLLTTGQKSGTSRDR